MPDYEKEKMEKAYAEGIKQAKEEGFFEDIAHGIANIVTAGIPLSKEEQSREAGYQDAKRGKV